VCFAEPSRPAELPECLDQQKRHSRAAGMTLLAGTLSPPLRKPGPLPFRSPYRCPPIRVPSPLRSAGQATTPRRESTRRTRPAWA
jgi:hypothetical protein